MGSLMAVLQEQQKLLYSLKPSLELAAAMNQQAKLTEEFCRILREQEQPWRTFLNEVVEQAQRLQSMVTPFSFELPRLYDDESNVPALNSPAPVDLLGRDVKRTPAGFIRHWPGGN